MNRRLVTALGLAAALALPAAAQDKPAAAPANAAAAGMGGMYHFVSGTLLKTAEKMPEENYSFKPTPEVRSFGQLVAHVADSQNYICKMALGQEGTPGQTIEKSKTSKADLIAALKESSAGCEGVYKQSDADLSKSVKLFGMDMNRYAVATLIVGHDYEHYGNMVTYMRLKGIVPPTSERQGPPPAKKDDAKKDEGKK